MEIMKRIAAAKLFLALFLLAFCLPARAVNITIRLGCDIAIPQAVAPGYNTGQSAYPLNLNTGGQPVFTRGDAIGFQLSFLNNGTLFNSTNFTNVVGVYLALNQSQFDTNAPMLLGYEPLSAFNTNLSRQAWLTGNNTQTTNQHVTIPFASSLTGVSLQGAASQQYWMSIYFTNTDGSTVTALSGPITVQDRPLNYLSPAPILNGVTVNGSNQITYPGASNFFQANSNALNSAVSALAGGVQVAPGTNVTAQTNGNVVTISSSAGGLPGDGVFISTNGVNQYTINTNANSGTTAYVNQLASNAVASGSNGIVAAAVTAATNDAAAIAAALATNVSVAQANNAIETNTFSLTNSDGTISFVTNYTTNAGVVSASLSVSSAPTLAAAGAASTNYVGQLATGIIPAPNIQIGGLNIPTTSMNQLWSGALWYDTNLPTDMGNPFGGFAFDGTNWYGTPASGVATGASGIGCKFLVMDTNGNVFIANTNQPSLNAVSRLGYNNCCAMTPYKGLYYQIINILTNAGSPPTYVQGAASNVLCVFSNNGYMLSMTDLHWAPNVLEEIVFLTNGYAAICLFDGSNNTPNDYSGANRVLIYNPTNWTYTGTNITIVNPPYGGGSGYSGMALSGLDSNTLYFDGGMPTGFPQLGNTNVFFTYSLNPQTGIMTPLINRFTTNFGQYYTGGDVKVLPIDPVSHTYNPHIIYWLGNGVGTLVSNVYGSNATLIPNQIISYSVDTTNQPVALNATGISSIPFPVFNTNANLGRVAYIAPLEISMNAGAKEVWGDAYGAYWAGDVGNNLRLTLPGKSMVLADESTANTLLFYPYSSLIDASSGSVNFPHFINTQDLVVSSGKMFFVNNSTAPGFNNGYGQVWCSNYVPYWLGQSAINAFALQGASPSFGTVTASSFSGSGNALTGTNQANSGNLQSGGTNGAAGMVPTFTGAGGTWTAQTPSGGVTLTQLNTVATNATNYTATTIANGFNTASIGITNSPASFTMLTTANGQIYEPYDFQGGQFWRQFVLSNVWNLQDANAANAITVSNITDTVNFAGNINGASNLTVSGTIIGNGSGLTNVFGTNVISSALKTTIQNGSPNTLVVTNGNVGIGTTNPTYPFMVVGSVGTIGLQGTSATEYTGANMLNSSGALAASFQYWNSSAGFDGIPGNSLVIGTRLASAPLIFITGAGLNERMRIDSSGNVGIGTTTPSAQLTVATDIIAGGTTTATIGFASFATNQSIISSSTTISNNQAVNMVVYLTAATGLSMTNGSGGLVFSGQTVAALTPFTLQPKAQLVGTAITCVGTNGW